MKERIAAAVVLLAVGTAALIPVRVHRARAVVSGEVANIPRPAVFFAPGPDCETAIVREISAARIAIRVAAYSFTSAPVAAALVAAKARGVDVAIVLDRSNLHDAHGKGPACLAAGILVAVDSSHKIAHNKYLIVDGNMVVTGSWNMSISANGNAENMLIIRDAVIARTYSDNWLVHRLHSTPFPPPAP